MTQLKYLQTKKKKIKYKVFSSANLCCIPNTRDVVSTNGQADVLEVFLLKKCTQPIFVIVDCHKRLLTPCIFGRDANFHGISISCLLKNLVIFCPYICLCIGQ
jgi:hypothetical protein